MAQIHAKINPTKAVNRSEAFAPLWNWVGVLPFFIFIFVFLILPSTNLFVGAFQNQSGNFTLANVSVILDPYVLKSYSISLQISVITSVLGGVIGFFVAYAITIGKAPVWMRNILMSFSGLAANFGGVPLAFAFIATLGHTGFLTAILRNICFPAAGGSQTCPFDIYQSGFNLYSVAGLTLAYLYFQFPLMVLTITPALVGLKREWQEASENLGGSSAQYWWHVALPMARPAVAVIVIFNSLTVWNEYILATLLLGDSQLMPLQRGLMVFQGANSTDYPVLMAGLTMAAIPIIMVYLTMQKHIIKGLSLGEVAG